MPGGNRTGPRGIGPLTGRRMGLCAGFPAPGFMSPGTGYGMGRGMGFGRGFGRGMGLGRGRGWGEAGYSGYWDYPTPQFSKEDEMAYLETQAKEIKDELNQIKTRMEELKMSKDQSEEK